MVKIENVNATGFQSAIRGMRNPLNSWDKSDSGCQTVIDDYGEHIEYVVGKADLDLMRRLYKAGPEHRKYLRMITTTFDLTGPLYFLKELDTYKVASVCNSCSTMHKITAKEFSFNDFSHEHLKNHNLCVLSDIIDSLNYYRAKYLVTGDKDCWWQLIQMLPSSYNQRRTYQFNYETLLSMLKQRRGHKLDEWRTVCEMIEGLPYVKDIIGGES